MKKVATIIVLVILCIQGQSLLEWEREYKGPAQEDEIRAIAVDNYGNVYVTGRSDAHPDPMYFVSDWVTISYDLSGIQRWLDRIESQYNDVPFDLKLNKQNDVYITGAFQGGWRTDKHNYLGELIWERSYPTGSATSLVLDREGNIYVTGYIGNIPWDIQTVKYNPEGVEQWRTVLQTVEDDQAFAIALDSNGNVFVTGITGLFVDEKCITIKYDASGNIEWSRIYPGGGGPGLAIEVDLEGNVFVAAHCDCDYVTIKYDSYGNEQWSRRYGEAGVGDEPRDLLVDEEGNAYITGSSKSGRKSSDFLTIKYNTLGDTVWLRWYDYQNWQENCESMVMDNLGYIYIAGGTQDENGMSKLIIVKYNRDGLEQWSVRYDDGFSNCALTAAVAVDAFGNGYLGSGVPDDESNVNYITLKYRVSDSPLATFPNQGRHLVRTPNITDFDWTYEGHDERLIQQNMGDLLIGPPTYLTKGKYPTIAKNEPASPWISYTTGDSLYCLFLRDDGSWKKVEVAHADTIGAPSLVLSLYPDPTGDYGDLGYVVYTTASDQTGQRYICFSAFDSVDVFYYTVFDAGNVTSPSIALTPGDYLHVVWKKDNRIYYITTRQPVYPDAIRQGAQPDWSTIDPISTPQYPTTEPASNPFVEAQGEWVYAVWRGPNEEGNPDFGEIWQRRGEIRPGQTPRWRDPENKSQTLNEESNFPTMSTGTAVVWQESIPENPPNNPANYEIYGDIIGVGNNINLTQTGKNSCYPHTNLLLAPPYSHEDWRLFTIWTEESIPDTFYKVRYDDYYFSEPDTNIWPLSIPGGDSTPSPYCLERDGFIQFNGMNIDYDSTSLAYIIPYMNPRKHYLLEAIAYHESSGVYRQSFTFKNRSFEVRLRRAIPETLRVIIPSGFYDSTFINLRINRVQGNFAALAKLRLYEFEIINEKEGGAQSLETSEIPLKTSLFSPFPNPFTNDISIKYQVSKLGRVSLKVFNISGREVKTLTNENKEPGIYTVNFDGKDAHGLGLPLGIYFIQLKTETLSISKKVILAK